MFSSSILVMAIVAFIASPLTDACRCIGLEEPRQCRTDYLALVQIKGFTSNEEQHKRLYNFELIADLTPKTAAHSLRGFRTLETGFSTAECGAEIENGTYLIGGQFREEPPYQPHIFTCHAYLEQWQLSGERATVRLDEIKRQCDAFRAAPQPTATVSKSS